MNTFKVVDSISDVIIVPDGNNDKDECRIFINVTSDDGEKRSIELDLSGAQILAGSLVCSINRVRAAKKFYNKYQLKLIPNEER